MKSSLTKRIMLLIICLVVGTILACFVVNTAFLSKYYVHQKKNILTESFNTLQYASESGTLYTSEYDDEFESMCITQNVSIIIIQPNGWVARTSLNNYANIERQLNDIRFSAGTDQLTLLENGLNYDLLQVLDPETQQAEYLALIGILPDGNSVMIRADMESIRESAAMANQFLLYIGVFALAGSIIVSILISRKISELKSANDALQQDIAEKERVDEMRKEFLSNVSHELKTPLALIQGYAEGLSEDVADDPESRAYYCEVIVDEADKMNKMVQKLLTLNQLEFGNDQVAMERFDITELIQGVTSTAAILMEQQEITLQMDLPQEYVWADEFKVEEVITNYLTNAIHHADNEKIIRIFYEKKDTVLRISVFNTGRPIPEEDIEKIWDKFYKVDKARTRAYGGSGIGLSIVRAIMDSFHQKCGVMNHPDGVEFWFELRI